MRSIFCWLGIIVSALPVMSGSASAQATIYITPNYTNVIEKKSSPMGNCHNNSNYCTVDASVTGALSGMAEASSIGCNPTAEAGIYTIFQPSSDDDYEVRLTNYSLALSALEASANGTHGHGGAEVLIWLKVRRNSDGRLIKERWIERHINYVTANMIPAALDWNESDEPLTFEGRAGVNYRIEVVLEVKATIGCEYYHAAALAVIYDCGSGRAEATASINEIEITGGCRPFITAYFTERSRKQVDDGPEYDTWDGYEYFLGMNAAGTWDRYQPESIRIVISAGGCYSNISNDTYVILSTDGDSIYSWDVDPLESGDPNLTVTRFADDSIRVTFPAYASLDPDGGTWNLDVKINPEIDETRMALCSVCNPIAALMGASISSQSLIASELGIGELGLYNRDAYQVYIPCLGWTEIDPAILEGWLWKVLDPIHAIINPPGGGGAPRTVEDLLDQIGGGYNIPILDQVRSEMLDRCRDTHSPGSDGSIGYKTFPSGDNSYAEKRDWGMKARLQGTGPYAGYSKSLTDTLYSQVNFRYWPGDTYPLKASSANLFQDAFMVQASAPADAANYFIVDTDSIVRGDSVVVSVPCDSGYVAGEEYFLDGAAVYCYLSLDPPGQPGKTGMDLEAQETRVIDGLGPVLRFPYITDIGPWHVFRMDTVVTEYGDIVPGRFCFDLCDTVLTAGDIASYFFGIKDFEGTWTYWTRGSSGQGAGFITSDFSAAAASPCEFSVLPLGGDILYIDDCDDLPVQVKWDMAFDMIGAAPRVDRYDVTGSSYHLNNEPGWNGMYLHPTLQHYKTMIWSSGTHASSQIINAAEPAVDAKNADYLLGFLDHCVEDPGLLIDGDNIADELEKQHFGPAEELKDAFIDFICDDGNHRNVEEPSAPDLVDVGDLTDAEKLVAAGCDLITGFDVIGVTAESPATVQLAYPVSGKGAVVSQVSTNSEGATARVVLSGFSFHHLQSTGPESPPEYATYLADILSWLEDSTYVALTDVTDLPPPGSFISANYPNPFNPSTTIRFGIRMPGHVSLKVYNVAGQLVSTLVDGELCARFGGYSIRWDGKNDNGDPVASGVYFYRLSAPGFTQTRKMVLLR